MAKKSLNIRQAQTIHTFDFDALGQIRAIKLLVHYKYYSESKQTNFYYCTLITRTNLLIKSVSHFWSKVPQHLVDLILDLRIITFIVWFCQRLIQENWGFTQLLALDFSFVQSNFWLWWEVSASHVWTVSSIDHRAHLYLMSGDKAFICFRLKNSLSYSISGHIFETSICNIFIDDSLLFFRVEARALPFPAFGL